MYQLGYRINRVCLFYRTIFGTSASPDTGQGTGPSTAEAPKNVRSAIPTDPSAMKSFARSEVSSSVILPPVRPSDDHMSGIFFF